MDNYYRPLTKLREGYVFPGVCDSIHRGGMHVCSGGWGCLVAPGGMCVVAMGGVHAWLLLGGTCVVAMGGACVVAPGACVVVRGGGHAWLLWGACVVAAGGVHGCSGGCVGYDEIRRYDQ